MIWTSADGIFCSCRPKYKSLHFSVVKTPHPGTSLLQKKSQRKSPVKYLCTHLYHICTQKAVKIYFSAFVKKIESQKDSAMSALLPRCKEASCWCSVLINNCVFEVSGSHWCKAVQNKGRAHPWTKSRPLLNPIFPFCLSVRFVRTHPPSGYGLVSASLAQFLSHQNLLHNQLWMSWLPSFPLQERLFLNQGNKRRNKRKSVYLDANKDHREKRQLCSVDLWTLAIEQKVTFEGSALFWPLLPRHNMFTVVGRGMFCKSRIQDMNKHQETNPNPHIDTARGIRAMRSEPEQ